MGNERKMPGREPSYGMAIQGGKRRSKTQMLIARLTEAANELAVKCDGLQLRCEELEAERDQARQSVRELHAENYELCNKLEAQGAQLAEARNKALDEAAGVCENVKGWGWHGEPERAVKGILAGIHALKS